ncbi:MAG TPA: translation initiation factor [Chitinophagaceae bacterium]|nr:translation initiation factor [Chitinophagaceae bacterium]
MSKKNYPDKLGYVYSTNPEFQFSGDDASKDTLPPAKQPLKIKLETKHRGGKTVTLIEGFIGKEEDLEELCKKLKSYCGTGGSAKDYLIIIQGDHSEKVLQWLMKNGYAKSRKI